MVALEKRYLKVVKVEGDHYQIGKMHGKILKNDIREMIRKTYRIFKFYTGFNSDDCLKKVIKFIPKIKELTPELSQEITGIAEGAEVRVEEVFMLNLHARNLLGGCTSFVYRNGDAEVLIGQTIDWAEILEPHWILLKIKLKGDLKIAMFTKAGIIGNVGMNSAGISLLMNILLTDEKIKEGIPAHLIMRKILEQNRIGKILDLLTNSELISEPFNYMVADSNGEVYDVESLISGNEIFYVSDKFFVHTNHILSNRFMHHDAYVKATGSTESIIRYNRLKRLGLSLKKATIKKLMNLLRDHVNYPESICRHSDPNIQEEGKMKTLGAVIMSPCKPELWISYGNPCEYEFIKYELNK